MTQLPAHIVVALSDSPRTAGTALHAAPSHSTSAAGSSANNKQNYFIILFNILLIMKYISLKRSIDYVTELSETMD